MDIQQAGVMAFGSDGVLFIGDTRQGAIYAVATGDTKGDASKAKIDIKELKSANPRRCWERPPRKF